MHVRAAALAAVLVVATGGCGAGDGANETAGPSTTASAPPTTAAPATSAPATAPAAVEVPEAVLTDVASGEEVSLRSFVPSERPVLFWFWAPH